MKRSTITSWKKNNEEQALQIQQLVSKDEENSRQIEFLKQQVEELLKMIAPESCHQISKQGITRGQDIFLDPDGINQGKKAAVKVKTITLTSLISAQQILFFLRHFSYLHALLEPTRLFIFWENSYLHDY